MGNLREKIRSGAKVFGTFLQIGEPTMVEVLGRAGADFAVVDFEHGGSARDSVASLVRAGDVVGLPLIVRLSPDELSRCSQMLDAGIRGVLVPRVTAPEQAEEAVTAARYGPLGDRGACPGIRASDYGWLEWKEHEARADERTIVAVAVEGSTGLSAASEIATVPGIDFLFVGVFDLAHSLGHPGEVEHPEVIAALGEIVSRSAASGVAVGSWAPDLDVARRWVELGITVVTVSTDVILWRNACNDLMAGWHRIVAGG
jgi:4-hydroxy-2-oxoheptanedioate aldolase